LYQSIRKSKKLIQTVGAFSLTPGSMSFIKKTSLASVSTAVSMISGLLTTKIVSQIIGPEGMAYTGQFSSISIILALLASGACATGITKYVAEYDDERRKKLLGTTFSYVFICTLVISIITYFFANQLSENAFKTKDYSIVFAIYALFIFFGSFNTIAGAMLVGLQDLKKYTLINIFTSIINVIVIILLAKAYGIKGAITGMSVSSFFTFIFYFFYVRKMPIVPAVGQVRKLYTPALQKVLLNFALMSLVTGLLVPGIQLFVRSKLMVTSTFNAGIWQATTRISDYYLNFVYAVLSIYYLPKLSELQHDPVGFRKEIRLGFARIIPIVCVLSASIWLCRGLIIRLLLTPAFTPMLVLLKYQLVFDVIKIASWLLGYVMWAKALRNTFIATEIIFSILFVVFSNILINQYGTIGAIYAFGLNYTLYLLSLLILFRKTVF
jgi:PST family polysaccharide transporter